MATVVEQVEYARAKGHHVSICSCGGPRVHALRSGIRKCLECGTVIVRDCDDVVTPESPITEQQYQREVVNEAITDNPKWGKSNTYQNPTPNEDRPLDHYPCSFSAPADPKRSEWTAKQGVFEARARKSLRHGHPEFSDLAVRADVADLAVRRGIKIACCEHCGGMLVQHPKRPLARCMACWRGVGAGWADRAMTRGLQRVCRDCRKPSGGYARCKNCRKARKGQSTRSAETVTA